MDAKLIDKDHRILIGCEINLITNEYYLLYIMIVIQYLWVFVSMSKSNSLEIYPKKILLLLNFLKWNSQYNTYLVSY